MTSEINGQDHKDGDSNTLSGWPVYDDVVVPPMPGFMKDGIAKRFQDIRDFETNAEDIVLATYIKAGMLL